MPPAPGWRHRGRRPSDRAAHRRDRAAAETDQVVALLYRAHYRSLTGSPCSWSATEPAAEEIVESAFVSLHRTWPHLAGKDRALAYMRGAVVSGHAPMTRPPPIRPAGQAACRMPPGQTASRERSWWRHCRRSRPGSAKRWYSSTTPSGPTPRSPPLWVSAAGLSCATPNAAYPPFARAGYWTDQGRTHRPQCQTAALTGKDR